MSINPYEVLKKMTDTAAKIADNEKFAVAPICMKLKQAAYNHPNDQTIRMMHNVLTKMETNGKILISRAEMRDLYNNFAYANNKAADYCAEELKLAPLPSAKIMSYSEDANVDIVANAMKDATDSAMYNALSQIWGEDGKLNKKASYDYYSPEVAKKAEQVTSIILASLGAEPNSVKRYAGSENYILCDASYQTPIGEAHVVVPVEISKSGALLPNVFVTKHGFADLTNESIRTHIRETAGHSLQIDASHLLEALSSVKKLSSLNEIELQLKTAQSSYERELGVMKMASAAANKDTYVADGIYLSGIDPEDKAPIALASDQQKEVYAAVLETPKGMAEQLFGHTTVHNGQAIIVNKFASLGYKSKVALASHDDDSITYAARIDTHKGPLGFEVLVDVKNNKLHLPEIIAAQDKVYEFNSNGIQQAIAHNKSDINMVAKVSPMYELKASEVLERMRVAADQKDYKTAEDALNVLAVNGPKEIYALAVNEYTQSLSGKLLKQAAPKHKCSRIVKSANHSCELCGHLNMPLDKVYQDEFGHCRPLYRKAMEETYEGVLFNTSKIFM